MKSYCQGSLLVLCYLLAIRGSLVTAQCWIKQDCPEFARCLGKRCKCNTGFIRVGDRCVDMDECRIRNSCSVNAECENQLGGYICQCKEGFRGDGNECIDADECNENRLEPVCYEIETCQNNQGGFTCFCNGNVCHSSARCIQDDMGRIACACAHGFEGNGVNCFDYDECFHETHNCTQHEKCVNTLGGYKCSKSLARSSSYLLLLVTMLMCFLTCECANI